MRNPGRPIRTRPHALRPVADVQRELAKHAHALAEKRAAALGTIIEIQNGRKQEASSENPVASIGSLRAWQHDAAGMFVRYWQAEDRAMQLRRKMRRSAQHHTEMRPATDEEHARLRSAGRSLTRSERLLSGIEEVMEEVSKRGPGEKVKISECDKPMTKARLDEIRRGLDPTKFGWGHWKENGAKRGREQQMEMK